MLVYGDAERRAAPAALLAGIRAALCEAARTSGVERHGWLAAALIEAGELAQGVADALFAALCEVDAPSPEADAALAAATALARRVARSWDTGFAEAGEDDEAERALDALAAFALPPAVSVRLPEGFAHYAVYPEAYLEAARALPGDRLQVVGIRSIGTALAAIVAAAGRPAGPPVTLRPVGHPFDRRIAAAPALDAALRDRAPATPSATRFVIADEGPGLSGSSVAAAARYLAGLGVAADRIAVLPSHDNGPGPEASPETRAFWERTDRRVVTFDDLVLRAGEPSHRLENWFADVVGPATGPLADLSGGAWRERRPSGADLPPVHAWGERRKFLLPTRDGPVLLRFAGLGRTGLTKLGMARRLHEAGFVPEPLGFRHGFLAERWLETARPLDLASDRPALLDRLGAYLGFRARSFPAEPGRGATAHDLQAMLRRNTRDLGIGTAFEAWTGALDRLEAVRSPVATDNRLHAWEWLVTEAGILKADALDHHAGHDLVGPQDVAWDVAGAGAELGLTPYEEEALAGAVERAAGRSIDPDLLAFLRPCYLAFQYGYYVMAGAGVPDGPERGRLDAEAARYRHALVSRPTGRPG